MPTRYDKRTGGLRGWLRSAAEYALRLLFPPVCPVCGERLGRGERFVCTACRYRIPTTGFWLSDDNVMAQRLWGEVPARYVSAFFWYIDGSEWQRFVRRFKYSGRWSFGYEAGIWYGGELARSGKYGDVDVVVPVPLHWIKRMQRGYNQSEHLAEGIARSLGCRTEAHAVRRIRNNPSQTRRSRNERWHNVEGIFRVVRPERLRGRHILLVDDVFTTGATVISCAEAITNACAGEVTISVATLAVSHRLVGE